MERKQPSLELPSTSTAEVEANRYIQEQSLEDEEELEMKTEEFEELHVAIRKGDFESVRSIVQCHAEERYFSFEDTSALYQAFQCKKYNIISLLIHRGAKFAGSDEEEDVHNCDIDLDHVNHILYDYNRKSDKACVYRLMSLSQSPQGLDGDRLKALKSLYEHLFRCDTIKSLLKVLESVDFDIVFDFESDTVNRVHRLYEGEGEIYGLTLSIVREIFIGGKNLLCGDPRKRATVYGVVAEELCHLALTAVFQNNAKAYSEEDSKLIREFDDILLAVKAFIGRSCHTVSVIKDVFEYYKWYSWECELIARVPHVVGIYGEEFARRIFQESDELSMLLEFYDKNVLPKCREYTDTLLNTKSHRIRKQLMGKNEFISFREKQIRPLIDDYPSFREYVVVEEGVSVISTNCIKLSILHVYHELKPVCGDQFERKCLFFSSECFEKKREVILNAFKCKIFKYLVLVLEDKQLHHRTLLCKYLDEFEEFQNEEMNIIIISNSQFLGPEFEDNFVEYKWGDLTDEYKDLRTHPTEYIFKGDRWSISIKKEDVPKLFLGEDILNLISGDLIEVRDHADLNCQGYNLETYVERQFQATIIDNNIFKSLPNDSSFLIYGLYSWDFGELSINERQVQWLKGSDDVSKEGKTIFIDNRERPMNFSDFVKKTAAKNSISLHYYKKVFYLMNSEGDVWKQHQKEIRQTEGEIIDWLKSNKTLIISDNAGSGKSTVMSRLIWHVRREIYNSWVLSVDLNKFSIEDEGTDSEEDDDEELFEDILEMLGLENGFEKFLFMDTYNQENYFIFLDALDEIQSKYKRKALKLIAFIRRKTKARIIITTRMHHQKELEEILNAFSHQLVPFDDESQVHCLGKLLHWKLKFPSGEGSKFSHKEKKAMSRKISSIIGELEKEKDNLSSHDLILAMKEIKLDDSLDSIRKKIDCLNFSELAKYILKKTCLDRETVQFMGIPLHLFMIGSIYFDSNFKLEINSGIYSIYSIFIDLKIRIYVEEKQGILREEKEKIMKERGKDAYRIHIDLANQLMDKGKIEIINMSKEDKELCAALGIVSIKGEQIDFLHHTFTEYFRAESIRKDLKKDVFIDVLFEDKYEVVRRFLVSALEEKGFENLTKEFFKDLEFLYSVLKRSVEKYRYVFGYYESNLKFDTIPRIVKCLMESFEYSVDPNCLNEFVLALRSELSFDNWYVIGGCLSVNMIKILFNQSNDYLKLMFGVFQYYSNPTEVIELLRKCISIENSGQSCDSNERENEKRKAESLLKVLKFKDLKRRSLLLYAALNVRIETFPKILEFSRNSLGEELLFNEIIGSEEYKKAMDDFIDEVDFNRICGFLKTFHSVFGKQIDIFFYEKLKFSILEKTLEIEMSNEFGEIINLFRKCFEMEKLKEVLLSCDSNSYYLIHILVGRYKNVFKNLNIVRNILVESSEMKQFLMIKDRISKNIFHYAAKNGNVNFGDILEFCSNYLEKHEIEEMLTICDDENGWNVLHYLFIWNSTEIIEYLDVIKNTLDNDELFKNLLKGEDKKKRNIFHCVAGNKNVNFGDLLEFCSKYLEKHEIVEMLASCDEEYGWNVLHLLFRFSSTEWIIECLDVIKKTLDNNELFKNLLKVENKDKFNIFHYAAEDENVNFGETMKFCGNYLGKHEIVEMLTSCDDKYGWNVLHFLFDINSTKRIIECLDVIKNTLDNDELFKNLLKVENKDKFNIFHFAAENRYANFGETMKSCGNYLDNHEIVEMLTSCDDLFGRNALHFLFGCNSTERIIECLDVIKKTLDNDELFKNLLKGEDKKKRNIFHFTAENINRNVNFGDFLEFCSNYLEKHEIEEMLTSCDDKYGWNVLHCLFQWHSTERIIEYLDVIKNTLDNDELFKQLLKGENEDKWNIIHFAVKNERDISFLSSHFQCENEIKELLIGKSKNGDTILHFAANRHSRNLVNLFEYSFETLKVNKSQFEELIMATNINGDTFLHQFVNYYIHFREELVINLMKSVKEKVSEDIFKKLLSIRNGNGKTCLQIKSNYSERIIECFKTIFEESLFEELLNKNENNGEDNDSDDEEHSDDDLLSD